MIKTKMDKVDMNRLSDLSYLDMPPDLALVVSEGGKVSVKELADYYLANPDKYKSKPQNVDRDKYLEDTLQMCSTGIYKDINIVDYENQNVLVDGGEGGKIENSNPKDTGLVAYAFETSPESVTVVYRGSELQEKSGSLKDWIDNALISLGIGTEQQKEAVKFLERVGANEKYKIIDLGGHSKGGSNAIYAFIKCMGSIRNKINKCYTYNAPGQPKKFIEENKDIIDSIEGKIFNYQYKNDIVSSFFYSIGQVYIIENDKSKYISSLIDYHQLYSAKIVNNLFKMDSTGEKDVLCDVVHNISNELRMVLSDKEIDDLVKLIDKLTDPNISEVERNELIDKVTDELHIIIPAIETLLKYFLMEYISTSLKNSDSNIAKITGYTIDKLSDIKRINELAKIRIDNKFGFIKRAFWQGLKDLILDITSACNKFINVVKSFEQMKETAKENIVYSLKHSKFHINEYSIDSYINLYNLEIENMNSSLVKINKSIGALLREGWEGKSKVGFIDIQYKFYEKQIKDCIEEMQEVVEFLKECKNAIPDLYVEEKYLADVLGGY